MGKKAVKISKRKRKADLIEKCMKMVMKRRRKQNPEAVFEEEIPRPTAFVAEQWLFCQTDVNKLVKRDGSIDEPLFSEEESAWAAETSDGTAETKDNALHTEKITLDIEEITPDTNDIKLAKPIDVIDEVFTLEERPVQDNNVDENKDVPTDWVIHKRLCRCCHAEGDFTSLLMETGEDDLSYDDMLLSCFNIQLHPVVGASAMSLRGLCALCSARLRDAHAFSRQVRAADTRFQHLYTNNCITVAGAVKIEVTEDDPFESDDIELCRNESSSDKVKVVDNEPRQPRQKKDKCKKKPTKYKKRPQPTAQNEFSTQVGDKFKCNRCDQLFQNRSYVAKHYKNIHLNFPKQLYKCNHCQTTFNSSVQRTLHKLEAHNIDERYKCNACDKVFNKPHGLRNHNLSYHMLGENIKCSLCDFECYAKHRLQRHMVKHKNKRDYQCKYCKKAFLRSSTLDSHERIHTGDKRKVCAECGQAFVQKASLNYHMTKYHPGVSF